ncbi:MAG: GntR family transcriptional regulator [Clostridia bacterium]
MIKLDYKSGRSIHEQIKEGIKELIISGALKENDKLPSVRELSLSLTVNPNTVQKAYKELEFGGIIYSVQGKGNFVSPFKKADDETVLKLFDNLEKIVKELEFLGVDRKEIEKIIEKEYEREDSK